MTKRYWMSLCTMLLAAAPALAQVSESGGSARGGASASGSASGGAGGSSSSSRAESSAQSGGKAKKDGSNKPKDSSSSSAKRDSEYWIGVQLGELNPILKEQLNLEHGLAVEAVIPGGPAAKAGLKKNDILLKVGDHKLTEPAQLIQAVNEAKGAELPFAILRGGKEQELKVAPVLRPGADGELNAEFAIPPEIEAQLKQAREALEQAGADQADLKHALEEFRAKFNEFKKAPGAPGVPPINLELFGPAFVFDGKEGDLQISIEREGAAPAEIIVSKDGQTWEVTDKQLDQLPEEIRKQVQAMLDGAKGDKISIKKSIKRSGGSSSKPKSESSTPRSKEKKPDASSSGASGAASASASSSGGQSEAKTEIKIEVNE